LERRVEERTAALRRSEATTKAILDAVPDMMFLIDRDCVFLDFIPAAADEPLVPPEIFLGKKIRDIMPPEVAEDHVRCVEKALQSGEMQVAEYQLELYGEIKHYEARIVISGEGRVLALARDVTERVRAEEQFLQTATSLQQAERLAHLGSWEMDIASGKSRWSDEFFRICGYEPGAFEPSAEIGLEIIHPDDRQSAAEAVQRACERGEPYHLEKRIVRPDGEVRRVLARGELVHGEAGQPVKMMGSFLDVTEQVQAREALRESEEKYRLLVENQNDLVIKFDTEGRLLFASPTYCKTFGKTEDELLNEQFMLLVHEDDRERVAASLATLAVDKRTTYHEERALTVDGWRWFGWSARGVFDKDGNIQAIISVGRDITDRVRVEAELRARNAELDRFTYTVSHDLKNPLITITGFLGFLERDLAAGDTERVKTDIARISNAALKMERLLDELLQLSRIGRVVNPPEETPLSELLRDALDMVAGKLAERGVQVQFVGELLRADELVIYGDRTRLLQVLQNLLDNAIKFMGDQPQPRVEIGARRDDARGMVYYVRDNGIGIDPCHHEQIFDLFEKLDPGGKGSGVGLALVKRIVEVHGGSVWVESEGTGQGSAFCFTIEDKA
jgi:PAS domain S-box-containing protein